MTQPGVMTSRRHIFQYISSGFYLLAYLSVLSVFSQDAIPGETVAI